MTTNFLFAFSKDNYKLSQKLSEELLSIKSFG